MEKTAEVAGCAACGVQAEAHVRLRVDVRDLPCFGRPARLVWMKRRWRCREADCPARTWTETEVDAVAPRAVLTLRAGIEATRLVGELAQPVASVARELGVLVDGDGSREAARPAARRGSGSRRPGAGDGDRREELPVPPSRTTRRLMRPPRSTSTRASSSTWWRERRQGPEEMVRCTGHRVAGGVSVVATDLTEHYRAGMSPTSSTRPGWGGDGRGRSDRLEPRDHGAARAGGRAAYI